MARPTAPPGPPPPHYRPPGTPRPPAELPVALRPDASSPPPSGVGAGAVTAVAFVTLIVGLVAGFFLGRAYDDDSTATSAPVTTAEPPPSAPPRTGDTIPQDPPTRDAPASPPSTDLAPAAIGTFESPVPVGQAYVLGLYEIEVRAVDRDATDALRRHDADNPAPPAGRQHVLVEVAVRLTDPAGLGNPAAIPFFLSDGTAEWSAFDGRCGSVPDPMIEAGFLAHGEEAVGNLCFTVPADVVDDVALATESFSGPLYFALP